MLALRPAFDDRVAQCVGFSAPQTKKEYDPAVPVAWLTMEKKGIRGRVSLFESSFTPREARTGL
jgi:hypothetical protein